MGDALFVDAMQASVDFFGPGAVEVPNYQDEIVDMVRRRGTLGQRIREERATGQPSRYFEQTRIVKGAFREPRTLQHTPGNDPTRRERFVTIKAIQGDISFGMFDVEVTRQQNMGSFPGLVAKDLEDTVQGCLYTSDDALWNGTDTSLVIPTSNEYVGLLTQINRTASIASTASIIDGLKAEVASLISQKLVTAKPTAIYVHPVLGDLIDQEERLNQRQIPTTTLNTATGGLTVNAIATQAGLLPLFPEPLLPGGVASTTESGKTDYNAVILTEPMVERHYVTSPRPRVFALGLDGGLATRYTVVLFDAVVAKGKANLTQAQNVTETSDTSYCHSVVTVVR